jgi:hypothetical protein
MNSNQEKMKTNQDKMVAKIGSEIKTTQEKMVTSQERTDKGKEEMKAQLGSPTSQIDAN